MSSTSRITRRALAAGVALVAVAAPPAAAQQDLRMPDRRDPAPVATQDLRMPDRRDPAPAVQPKPEPVRSYRDLRSADARDDRRVVTIPASPAPVAEPGFDWGDAAIGGGVLAVLSVLSGTALVTIRRRHTLAAH